MVIGKLLYLLLLWLNFGFIYANSNGSLLCEQEHIQSKYCRAEFVLKATIKSPAVNSTGSMQEYAAVIKTQIKVNKKFIGLDESVLKSVWLPKSFSTSLDANQKYLISGSIVQSNMGSFLEHRQRAIMRKQRFETGCTCNTDWAESTRLNSCRIPWNKLKFVDKIQQNRAVEMCFDTQSYCTTLKRIPHCSWTINRELINCLEKISK